MFRASRSFVRMAHRASLAGPASQKLPQLQLQASKLLPITQRVRFASKSEDPPPPKQPIDREHEKELAQQKLKSDPSKVSSTSTVAHAGLDFGPSTPTMPSGKPNDNPDIGSGLKNDIVGEQSRKQRLLTVTGHRSRYLPTLHRSSRILHPWSSWYTTLPRHLSFHRVSSLGP